MNILLVLLLSLVFVLVVIIIPCYKSEIRNLSKNPKNNVHFYVERDKEDNLYLYLGKPNKEIFDVISLKPIIAHESQFYKYKLNKKDFERLTFEDEPVEVFLNLED